MGDRGLRSSRIKKAAAALLAGVCALASAPVLAVESRPAAGATVSTPVVPGVIVSGRFMDWHLSPVLRAGVTLVPAVEYLQALGATVSWDAESGVLQARRGNVLMVFRADSTDLWVGGKRRTLRRAPVKAGGQLYVPLRDPAEVLGYTVRWHGKANLVTVGEAPLPPVNISFNGRPVEGIRPALADGALVFPARALLEALGYEVSWDRAARQVTFRRAGVEGAFQIGRRTLRLGEKQLNLSTPPVLVNGRTYLPLNLLRLAGEDVRWNASAWTMQVRRPETVPTAVVEKVEGEAWVLRDGATLPAVPGTALQEGDLLETKEGSFAHVVLDDGTRLQIGSKVRINALRGDPDGRRQVSLKLVIGRILARVARQARKNARFELETPTGVVGVRGTTFVTEVREDGRSAVAVFTGSVDVRSGAGAEPEPLVVNQQQETVLTRADAPPPPPHGIREITVDPWLQRTVTTALVEEVQDIVVEQIRRAEEVLAVTPPPPPPGVPPPVLPDTGAVLEQMWQTMDTSLALPVAPVPPEVLRPVTPPPPPGAGQEEPGPPPPTLLLPDPASAPSLDTLQQFQEQLGIVQQRVNDTIRQQVSKAFQDALETLTAQAGQNPEQMEELRQFLEEQFGQVEDAFTPPEPPPPPPPPPADSGRKESDTAPPALTVMAQPVSVTIPQPVALTVSANEALQAAPVVTVTPPGGAPQTVAVSAAGPTTWTGTYEVTAASPDGPYAVNATGRDAAGNEGSGSATFTIALDRQPPYVFGQMPSDGARINNTAVTIGATVTDPSGVAWDSLVMKLDGAAVAGPFTVSGDTVTYTPPAHLAEGDHTVALSVYDRAGNQAAATWSFTVDLTPPALVSAYVYSDTLTLTYSEMLDVTSTPRTVAFTVYANGVQVSVTHVTVSENTVVLTLATPVSQGDQVTLNYAPADAVLPTRDRAGNLAAELVNQPVSTYTLVVG